MSVSGVLAGTLRVLRGAQLGVLFLFAAYFVCVQVNAVAYLAGRGRPLVPGVVPPAALGSALAAGADIAAGLVVEGFAAFVFFIVVALFRGRRAVRRA